MRSIGQKGYFEGEPLLLIEENDSYVVVEGNRRLAAVKLLNQQIPPPSRRSNSVAQIRDEAVEPAPVELPCILYSSRRDVMRYLGYRHITGIREWDALSKAKYLVSCHVSNVGYSRLSLTRASSAVNCQFTLA